MYALISAGIGFVLGYLRPHTAFWKIAFGTTILVLASDRLILVFHTIPKYGDADNLEVLLGFLPFAFVGLVISTGMYFVAAYFGARFGRWAMVRRHPQDEE